MTAQSEEGTCVRSAGNMMQATRTGGGAAAADDTITAIRRRWLHVESTAIKPWATFPLAASLSVCLTARHPRSPQPLFYREPIGEAGALGGGRKSDLYFLRNEVRFRSERSGSKVSPGTLTQGVVGPITISLKEKEEK
ncbi:hypothetical protein E2C01_037904 [Portunus trituberculatus]|uniref:Uncharacterized protein n=1 Tax=Portunus trituberculatus TaxID=210409 RepID=A0A5B7FFD3_PORTR|nr:hypothetical protein [Portunus trituberculatus]